jgi:hypothetical protein
MVHGFMVHGSQARFAFTNNRAVAPLATTRLRVSCFVFVSCLNGLMGVYQRTSLFHIKFLERSAIVGYLCSVNG